MSLIFKHCRVPTDVDSKKRWIEVIRACNNDEYGGGGLVCKLHFLSDDMVTIGGRPRLKPNSIPSIFLDLYSQNEEYNLKRYHELMSENELLKTTISRMQCDFDSQQNECSKIISDLKAAFQEKCEELNKLQKKMKQLEVAKASIEKTSEAFQYNSKNNDVSWYKIENFSCMTIAPALESVAAK